MKLKPVLACLLGLACVQTYAQTNDVAPEGKPHVQDGVTDPRSYYSRKAEGWFFYNEKERPEEKEEEAADPTLQIILFRDQLFFFRQISFLL